MQVFKGSVHSLLICLLLFCVVYNPITSYSQVSENIPSESNYVQYFGCGIYATSLVHCEPAQNHIKSYKINGFSEVVYDPREVGNATIRNVLGKFGTAAQFNSINENYIVESLQNASNNEITISVWINISSHNDWWDYVSNEWGSTEGRWLLHSDTNGHALFGPRDGQGKVTIVSSNGAIPLNKWILLTATYDGLNTISIYIDGNLMV